MRISDWSSDVCSSDLRRLSPGRKADVAAPWEPTCYRWDVLLPPMAHDDCLDPKRLCEQYEAQACEGLKDLLVMMTIRFPDADRIHAIWEDVRAFRSEERRVGKECVSRCRSRWSPKH